MGYCPLWESAPDPVRARQKAASAVSNGMGHRRVGHDGPLRPRLHRFGRVRRRQRRWREHPLDATAVRGNAGVGVGGGGADSVHGVPVFASQRRRAAGPAVGTLDCRVTSSCGRFSRQRSFNEGWGVQQRRGVRSIRTKILRDSWAARCVATAKKCRRGDV